MIANHSKIPRYSYEIHHYDGPTEEGISVKETPGNKLFVSDGSLASDFAAMGIIFREVYNGNKVLIIKNPQDEVEIDTATPPRSKE